MIDSASIVAIAEKTKDVLDQGQNLVTVFTSLALVVVGLVGYVVGLVKGKKEKKETSPSQ